MPRSSSTNFKGYHRAGVPPGPHCAPPKRPHPGSDLVATGTGTARHRHPAELRHPFGQHLDRPTELTWAVHREPVPGWRAL